MIREEICPVAVREALRRLWEAGYEAEAVGGCIRDSLLGKEPHDWDVTTSALPGEVKGAFFNVPVIPTGESKGTVTVLLKGTPLEITTYRIDGTYSDKRRPDFISFTRTLTEDLARRDFTVNAMAWSPKEGLVDCFNGQEDLKNRVIRCVGDPDQRFGEDALRILRALRFAATLDFSIESATAESLRKNREALRFVSAERVYSELKKLLCGPAAGRVLREFPEVFAVWIPELAPTFGFEQHTPYHLWDVWEHTIRSVEAIRPDPALRLTMLLHDIGKPGRFFLDEKGRGHFKGHPALSAAMTRTILTRLKVDGDTCRRVLQLIEWHDASIKEDDENIRRWLRLLGAETFLLLLTVKRADNEAKNLAYSDRGPELDRLEKRFFTILKRQDCYTLNQLAVTGEDLIQTGIPAGKTVGFAMEELLESVLSGSCPNEKGALLKNLPTDLLMPPDYPRFPLFQVRKGGMSDLPAVSRLLLRVCRWAQRQPVNPCGWRSGFYPKEEDAAAALSEGTLWILENGGIPAGVAVFNHKQAPAYRKGNWQTPAADPEVLVIHTLTVDPACSGRGGARLLIDAACKLGRETGCKAIRLDAFTGNYRAICLYENYGFRLAGTVDLGLNVPGLKWFRLYEYPLASEPEVQNG